MQNYVKAREVLKKLSEQLFDSKFFVGIEIAAYQPDGIYTNDLCIRILVNSQNLSNKELDVPDIIDDLPILVSYSKINPM